MTLKLELTAEEESRLQAKAANAGMNAEAYVRRLINNAEAPPVTLADTLRDFIGVVDGTPGPGDGRAWSEIEAACDPL